MSELEKKKFDVFISYRRAGGANFARMMQQSLKARGYDVFLDFDSLRDGKFDENIYAAIDNCKVFILILTKDTLDRCVDENDWVRTEIMRALEKSLPIVPVAPDDSAVSWPTMLPQAFANLARIQVSEMNTRSLFEESIDKIIRERFPREILREEMRASRFDVLVNEGIGFAEIEEAVGLDRIVYGSEYYVDPSQCYDWYLVNHSIYVMVRDRQNGKIVAYTNTAPVTDECYDRIKSGKEITSFITKDMLLDFDMPYTYSLYFFSVVIHPDYQNTGVFSLMLSALVKKFVALAANGIYIKRMLADAVTLRGDRFCKMFNMSKVKDSTHQSQLYEVVMIPPRFRIISRQVKELYDCYLDAYNNTPYLFN